MWAARVIEREAKEVSDKVGSCNLGALLKTAVSSECSPVSSSASARPTAVVSHKQANGEAQATTDERGTGAMLES